MNDAIRAMVVGEITFARFVRRTEGEWMRLAAWLHRRWSIPASMEVGDVMQELLIGAWEAGRSFDDTRGTDPARFVIWSAITRAKKAINRERGALRRDDRAPSRHPIAVSRLARDGGEGLTETRVSVVAIDPTQYERAEAIEHVVSLVAGLPAGEIDAVLAYVAAAGNEELAALTLYGSTRMRLALRLGCEDDARMHVRAAVGRVARSFAA
jgi:DNA-directed RNA polymerase specialized sigma24 family protein